MDARPNIVFAALLISCAACGPILERTKPAVERINPNIAPERFKAIATVAGENRRTDRQISATVRLRMQDSGLAAYTKPGTWSTETEAVQRICASLSGAPIDGVLFVWYNRLKLSDCETQAAAYEIGGAGASIGITAMTDKLIGYLKRGSAAKS